jgi:hypothetical protein
VCVCVCVCVPFLVRGCGRCGGIRSYPTSVRGLKLPVYEAFIYIYLFSAEDPEDGQELASAHLLLTLYHAVVAALVVQLGVLVQRVHVRVLDAVLLHQLQRRQPLVP